MKEKIGNSESEVSLKLFSQHPCLGMKIILQPVCSLQTQCERLRNTDTSPVE